jgi:farnesyl-diphosphate farnesyltransferase
MRSRDALKDLLQKTSRTFALTIPMLREPTRREVSVAYLLFRIIDTFEDATHWSHERRCEALHEFMGLMETRDALAATAATARWTADPPLDHTGYLELLSQAPRVLAWHGALAAPAREQISQHLRRTASGMITLMGDTPEAGVMRLTSLEELRGYCFIVAGIVGQLLTELYLLGTPSLASVADELRARSVRFGEGLQLVNILKDARHDALEGRSYLPPTIALSDVFELARADLASALEYCELLRDARADFGVVAFNALNARLALATLHVLAEQGSGSKLTRQQLEGLTVDVMRSIEVGAPLSPQP